MRLPTGKLDAHAHEALRRLGQRDHAEAERHAKTHRSLVQLHVTDEELRRGHVDLPPVLAEAVKRFRSAALGLRKSLAFPQSLPTAAILRKPFLPTVFARADLTR